MEEADVLADDINIISHGRLVAAGSSLELKARHGVGYTLTIILSQEGEGRAREGKDKSGKRKGFERGDVGETQRETLTGQQQQHEPPQQPQQQPHQQPQPAPQRLPRAARAVADLVSRSVPGVRIVSAAGAEVVMQLPREESGGFPQVNTFSIGFDHV